MSASFLLSLQCLGYYLLQLRDFADFEEDLIFRDQINGLTYQPSRFPVVYMMSKAIELRT